MTGSDGALSIKDIVNKVISDLSEDGTRKQKITEEDINRLWKKAAGKLAGARSRPTSLKKGRLVVAVADSSLLYDLTLRRPQILAKLARGLKGKIQDIQFRIGE